MAGGDRADAPLAVNKQRATSKRDITAGNQCLLTVHKFSWCSGAGIGINARLRLICARMFILALWC